MCGLHLVGLLLELRIVFLQELYLHFREQEILGHLQGHLRGRTVEVADLNQNLTALIVAYILIICSVVVGTFKLDTARHVAAVVTEDDAAHTVAFVGNNLDGRTLCSLIGSEVALDFVHDSFQRSVPAPLLVLRQPGVAARHLTTSTDAAGTPAPVLVTGKPVEGGLREAKTLKQLLLSPVREHLPGVFCRF